jgi:drug/metabolite transporter (DMT)-like permease
LKVFTAPELGALRMGLTFIFLIPFIILRIKKINLKKWYLFVLCGFIGNGIPAFLFAYAQTGIDSSLSGILNSLTPLFTLIIGMMIFRFRPRWYNIAGVLIGLAGTIGLISVSGHGNFNFNFYYSLFVIAATLLYAVNVNLIKYYLKDFDAISITTYAIGSVGIPAIIYLFAFTDFLTVMHSGPAAWHGLGIVAVLGVVGTGIAVMLYNYLIKITNVITAASVTYLMPVVAILWGLNDNEPFGLINILFIVVILFGVFLVNSRFGGKAITT